MSLLQTWALINLAKSEIVSDFGQCVHLLAKIVMCVTNLRVVSGVMRPSGCQGHSNLLPSHAQSALWYNLFDYLTRTTLHNITYCIYCIVILHYLIHLHRHISRSARWYDHRSSKYPNYNNQEKLQKITQDYRENLQQCVLFSQRTA